MRSMNIDMNAVPMRKLLAAPRDKAAEDCEGNHNKENHLDKHLFAC
jgi:hypothetical protein